MSLSAPTVGSAGDRPNAISLIAPLPPLSSLPSWRTRAADRHSGVSSQNTLAVVREAPLHSKIGALVQLLRFAGGADGFALPPLPAAETALLVAAESFADVQTSRTWRQVGAEIDAEGWLAVSADRTRQQASVNAGGARIDGVWSAQDQILEAALARDINLEAVHYEHLASPKDANPMNIRGLRPTGSKRSLEQRRRGQLAMRQMLERTKVPWVADKAALKEQKATRALLHEPSRLVARAEAWLTEGSVGNRHAAATKLQAAQRSKKAREEVMEKKKKASEAGGRSARKARPRSSHN